MFSRMSHPGIVFSNLRGLSFSLTVSSLVAPIIAAEAVLAATGILLGAYYGYKIEKETHELSSLGGRIIRGKSWDYLALS